MPWVRLDESFADHPKIERAGPLAAWLHVAALCYCSRHLTDGRIPQPKAHRLADIPNPAEHVSALLREGIWTEDGPDYVIHDYLDYQPSREQVMIDRGIARRRSAMNTDPELRKALKARDGNKCRYCGVTVNWRDRKSPTGATYDHVIPLTAGGTEALDNLVVCCRDCNSRKGPRTPEQAGMVLTPPPGDHGNIKNGSRPPSRPVPIENTPSSSGNSRGAVENPGDDGIPAAVWTHYAQLRHDLEPAGSIRNPDPWKRKAAKNAQVELGEKAVAWWTTFAFEQVPNPAYRLAQALVDGRAPQHIPRRQEAS